MRNGWSRSVARVRIPPRGTIDFAAWGAATAPLPGPVRTRFPRPVQRNLRVAFLLDITVYQQLLEAIKAYDEAKASGEQPIPLEDALRSIEESRS